MQDKFVEIQTFLPLLKLYSGIILAHRQDGPCFLEEGAFQKT